MRSWTFSLFAGIVIVLTGCTTPSVQPVPWISLLKGIGTEGWESGGPSFKRDGQIITGDDGGYGDRFMTGSAAWADYEFAADVRPVKGTLIQLHYRISDQGKRWYTLDLRPEKKAVTISFADHRGGSNNFNTVLTEPMEISYGTNYTLRVVVKGTTVTAYVNDKEIGRIKDMQVTTGAVGLGLFAANAEFRNPRIRFIK